MASRWIATAFDGVGDTSDAVIFEADDEEAAAQYAAEAFDGIFGEESGAGPVEHIFITEWTDRTAYSVTVAVKRSEMQCCGGPAPSWVDPDGHWGGCPLKSDREEDGEAADAERQDAEA